MKINENIFQPHRITSLEIGMAHAHEPVQRDHWKASPGNSRVLESDMWPGGLESDTGFNEDDDNGRPNGSNETMIYAAKAWVWKFDATH